MYANRVVEVPVSPMDVLVSGPPGAGHGFRDFTNPDRSREAASDDAWKKRFAFFDRVLKQPAAGCRWLGL